MTGRMRLHCIASFLGHLQFVSPASCSLATSDPPNCPYLSRQILSPANWTNQQSLLPIRPKMCQLNAKFKNDHSYTRLIYVTLSWPNWLQRWVGGMGGEARNLAAESGSIWRGEASSRSNQLRFGQISNSAVVKSATANLWHFLQQQTKTKTWGQSTSVTTSMINI